MENKGSLLNKPYINILGDKLIVRNPTIREILEDEYSYYGIISTLTAVPYQFMVQLDDIGIDFTTVKEYDLFKLIFMSYTKSDLSIIFGDLDISDFNICKDKNGNEVIYSPKNEIEINENVYYNLVSALREINALEKITDRPGNESAKKYLIEQERKKTKKLLKKKKKPYFEKMVVALVNTCEFPYNYDSCMDLSIYRFNQSFKQIQHKIAFNNTMIGVYSGTIDTSKLSNKEFLSWIKTNK